MKLVLAYNVYHGVSGEQVFFTNVSEKIADAVRRKGFDVSFCEVPQSSNYHINLSENYLRFPIVPNTYVKLKKFENHEIVHFLNASIASAGLFLKNKFKVATCHQLGHKLFELSPSKHPLRHLEPFYWELISRVDKKTYQNLDYLVACSPFQATDLARSYDLDKSKIKVIYPGFDISYYQAIPKTNLHSKFNCEETVVYLGRLQERSKGVSYLIRSMSHLNRRNLKLLIGGEGPDRKYYERLVSSLGLENRVIFLGKLDFASKSMIQKSADVLVFPSLYDVFCTVFAESLACEVPVVAFNQPFWKGLYDDAALFVNKDPKSLAEGIEKVLDDKNLRKTLVTKGKFLVPRYDVTKTVNDYVNLYLDLPI